MSEYDDDMQPASGDANPSLHTLVQRALARGLFVDAPYAQPFDDDERQFEFESLVPGEGRLVVELWSEGQVHWRAAGTWTTWAELKGDVYGEWTRAGGDGLWTLQEDAVVEALCAIAPCAAMSPVDLMRRREPSHSELEATALAMHLCSDRRLPLAMARQFVAQVHGWTDWDDMLRAKRSYGLKGQ